ncbi:MAG TPA: M56 family metallopeptidase, partial [Longimicrobiaceae bacterium]|nr:M56 family metallopeptidase [Longimicrobiaceae bacterium]
MTADHPLVRALGWALLHFVWQGALLAGLAALAMHLLRGRSPQARYAAGCAALLLMVAAPVATGLAAYEPAQALAAGPLPAGGAERQAVLARLAEVARQVRPADDAWRSRVEAALPSLVTVWLAGILVLSLRLLGGWGYAQRLARREVRPAAAALQRHVDELARRLELSRPVRLLESARVRVPTVVGWLRPVVLLPFAAATGLTPAQLEAVLLHELAHVRRHDYLVNLLQSAAEVLLFYHPGVWWVSERVREEREACCDDVAVAACGDALVYARALTRLEGLRAAPPRLAMAADGGSLLHRVRRLVLPAPQPARGAAPLLLGALLLATLAAAAAAQRLVAPPVVEPARAGETAPVDAGEALPAPSVIAAPVSEPDIADVLPDVDLY